MAIPQYDVALLLDAQPFAVPIAREQRLAPEKRAEGRRVQIHSLVAAVSHDVQQRLERWACGFDAAVLEIIQRDAPLRLDDCVDSGGEQLDALFFRPQQFLGEHGIRSFKNAAEVAIHKKRRDAIAQAAG